MPTKPTAETNAIAATIISAIEISINTADNDPILPAHLSTNLPASLQPFQAANQ
jgi:hypothetical protein